MNGNINLMKDKETTKLYKKFQQYRKKIIKETTNKDYSHISHVHCWNNEDLPCGIPLEKHTQCCLCNLKYPTWKERYAYIFNSYISDPKYTSLFEIVKDFISEIVKETEEKCNFCKDYPDGNYGVCGKCCRPIANKPTPPQEPMEWEEGWIREWFWLIQTKKQTEQQFVNDIKHRLSLIIKQAEEKGRGRIMKGIREEFYKLEEIEKEFNVNQEIIRTRNKIINLINKNNE